MQSTSERPQRGSGTTLPLGQVVNQVEWVYVFVRWNEKTKRCCRPTLVQHLLIVRAEPRNVFSDPIGSELATEFQCSDRTELWCGQFIGWGSKEDAKCWMGQQGVPVLHIRHDRRRQLPQEFI